MQWGQEDLVMKTFKIGMSWMFLTITKNYVELKNVSKFGIVRLSIVLIFVCLDFYRQTNKKQISKVRRLVSLYDEFKGKRPFLLAKLFWESNKNGKHSNAKKGDLKVRVTTFPINVQNILKKNATS